MAVITFNNFQGIAPKVPPYSLKDGMGQKAQATDLALPVVLRPLPGFETVRDLDTDDDGNSVRTVYLFAPEDTLYWFQGFETVDFVRGPLPEDDQQRTYFTDSEYPKITREDLALGEDPLPANEYKLGVPAPDGVPVINGKGGTADDDAMEYTTAYVQTFVTQWDEEGPPSEVSESIDVTPGETVELELVGFPDDEHVPYQAVRLYRLNSGTSSTEFQFVDEITEPLPDEYTDDKYPDELAETLPTEGWYPPPDSSHPTGPLQGLIGMPNGSLAGFTGETLCVSLPYLPHAWPFESRYTIKDRIVGLSPVSQGIVVLTDFAPYVAAGNAPEAMSITRLRSNQACVSKRSIVDMGGYVVFASPEGLVMTDGSKVELLTEALFEERDWQEYAPESIDGYFWDGKYVGFYDTGERKGGFIFNPEGGMNGFADLGIYAHAGHYEPRRNRLFLAIDDTLYSFAHYGASDYTPLDINEATATELDETMDGVGLSTAEDIVNDRDANGEFFDINDLTRVSGIGQTTVDNNAHRITVDAAPGRSAVWRSAIANTPFAQSLSDLRVVAKGTGRVAVYADGERVSTHEYDTERTGYQFFRLPSGFRAREWEVEVRVDGELYQVDLATARREIKDG